MKPDDGHSAVGAADATRNDALDDGELWSFFRQLIDQGTAIQQDYAAGKYPSYEHFSARMDAAARERLDEFKARRALAPSERVPVGEIRWLIERTYAKGYPAERREFWLGEFTGDVRGDSFDQNNLIWTTNALEAARFSSRKIAETLRYRHFHPEAPVEACEHLFQCGIEPDAAIKR